MPKETFHNLPIKKKEKITDAFLREFAIHPYDKASLSSVVKSLSIAKGSMYQYFDDKLDLFTYLIAECSAVKIKYVGQLKREDFPDFWAYFRALYEEGVKFDLENPMESHFLHSLEENLKSPSVKNLYDDMMIQTVKSFENMVQHEVDMGLFRDDVPIPTMGCMLFKAGVSIQEQLRYSGIINPKKSIQNNQPVYHGKKLVLMQKVDEYISLLSEAFNSK